MPIAVSCPRCASRYELGDELAGRRCRCKGCGTVFRIGELEPVASPTLDPFADLGAGPAASRRPASASAFEPDLPPPPRAPKPSMARAGRSRRDEGPDAAYRYGSGLLGFSLLMTVLPLIGLQWAVVAFLPRATQSIVAGLTFLAGGALLLVSKPATSWQKTVKFGGIGLVGLIVGITVWAVSRTPKPGPPPRFAGPPPQLPGQPPPQFAGPPPQFPGQPPQLPGPPRWAGPPPGMPAAAAPTPPVDPGRPAFATDPGDETLFALSNAQAARDPGPSGIGRGLAFRVDYRGGGRMRPGGANLWVVESPRTKARRPMPGITALDSGTLSGSLPFDRGDAGPFTTYIAREVHGPAGPSLVKMSNTVDMQWLGDQALAPASGDPANANGPPRGPFGPPGMPGRRGFPGRGRP